MKNCGNPFPGDHPDKQAARLFLYKYGKRAPIQGHAITLAGTDPTSEVKLMRDYLRWPAHRTWFVDKSKTSVVTNALNSIRRMWPEVNVRCADLKDLVSDMGAIGFANLDFMGAPLSDNNLACMSEVIPLLLPKAIIGVTWIRGRENISLHLSARRLYRLGTGFRGNERRWAGVLRAIDNLSGGELNFIDRWEYFNNHSPMSVAVFQRKSQSL